MDGGPAIARVDGECVYTPQFATYLRDLSLSLGLSGQGSEADESSLGEYFQGRRLLASEFGLENAAFATLAQDLALYQIAVAKGHSPHVGEVMVEVGRSRERIGGLTALLELHELARDSDLAGFRAKIESPLAKQMIPVQGEEHLLALFDEAGKMDLSGAAKGMEIHTALLESVGEDSYWTEVFAEHARTKVTIESLRMSVEEMQTDLPADLHWQNNREEAWGSIVIELTDAAPKPITLTAVRSYVDGYHALERDLLAE